MKRYFLHIICMLLCSQVIANNAFTFGPDLVTKDTFFVQTSDCLVPATACIDVPLADIGLYQVQVNGVAYSGSYIACTAYGPAHYDYSTLFGQGNLGPYMVNDWNVGGTLFSGEFFDINALVDSMNTWDPFGNWTLETASQSIFGGSPNVTYAQMDVTVVTITAPSFIAWSEGSPTDGTALTFDVGNHEIVLTEISGSCIDTFWVEAYCVIPSVVDESIFENETAMFCFDNSELPGSPSSVQLMCPNVSGTYVDFQLINNNTCVSYSALGVGVDSSCYVICDNFGICDTTILRVTVNALPFTSSVEWLYDTIYLNAIDSFCIDTSQLAGNVMSIVNDCPLQSGEYVSFNVNTSNYCVSYSTIDVGIDTACIQVTDDLGNIDTTYIVVNVVAPNTETIIDSLEIGTMNTWCVDSLELFGNVISFENICENTNQGSINFSLNPVTLCIEAEALVMGTDTACIVLCDDLGVCDSTFLVLSVSESIPSKPIANDDSVITSKDQDIIINICENDIIPNELLTNNYILPEVAGGSGPNFGFAVFNNECSITYSPVGTPCDVDDTFEYIICNTQGCDTATVTVRVTCDNLPPEGEVKIVEGFSPNGDDINDYFRVIGAEALPNNELSVFNRWGNQVFHTKGYENDWRGTWNNVTLEDGTYFYVFDDGNGNSYTGYVYIRR